MKVMNGEIEVDAAWIVPDDIMEQIVVEWTGAMGTRPGIAHAYIDIRPADDGSAALMVPLVATSWGSTGMSAPLSTGWGRCYLKWSDERETHDASTRVRGRHSGQ